MDKPEENSDDEIGLRTPRFLRRNSRISQRSPATPSVCASPIVLGPLSQDVLQVWRQLPEAIRLDPSLGVFKQEYERIQGVNRTRCSISGPSGECLVLNVSLGPPFGDGIHKESFEEEGTHDHETKQSALYRYLKLVILICFWLIFTVVLMMNEERVEIMHQVSVPPDRVRNYIIFERPVTDRIGVVVESSLLPHIHSNTTLNFTSNSLTVWLESWTINDWDGILPSYKDAQLVEIIGEPWVLPLLPPDLIDFLPDQRREHTFVVENITERYSANVISVNMRTNLSITLPVSLAYDLSAINTDYGIVYAAVILLGLYILIIFEIVHRAIAAMLASTMSLAVLAAMNERPTMGEVISWIDVDSLLLLFSMMIVVAIFASTGIFDYLAVYAYKITSGRVWPLVNTLCFFTAFISTVLDNVTTVLLMTPVTIRLCEVMELNPVPILTAMVVYSNIGGAITPVGDPPNVIIASNKDVQKAGIEFSTFVAHMGVGVLVVILVVYAQLRFLFRDVACFKFKEPVDVQELRHEIAVWQRAAASLSCYSQDENVVRQTLMRKIKRLLYRLKLKLNTGSVQLETYKTTLEELQEKYPIRDKVLLVKSGFALTFIIVLFFMHSLPNMNLSLGWIALIGVLLLLVLADSEDLEGLMARVEWSTLLFFASLFVLMEALSRMGLLAWIGKQTEIVILSVNEESRLAVAILLILWVSAIASAFIDNVPLCTMMVRIATNLSNNHELRLPLPPLVWALAFGACMGGNGTLIGATANVVCAGVAEQHGYKLGFMQFFRVGFPVMLSSTTTITIYLMLAHVVFQWHDPV
ncbi:P protein-like [Belonocnema kinseyi]|uniref:P protein-like n=1 Tax=Belonocnema kinseyi TaxID=2817044 RepID=UPI00143E0470|nr:P protein-like [Belonocnema kinseyi]